MLRKFDDFYQRYGIRTKTDFRSPRMGFDDNFRFPQNSIFHYIDYSGEVIVPTKDHVWFTDIADKIHVDFITQIKEPIGSIVRAKTNPMTLANAWLSKNRKFVKLNYDTLSRSPNALGVFSYSLIPALTHYSTPRLAAWYNWYNIEKTIWETIQESCKILDRKHFIVLEIPDNIPSLRTLDFFSKVVNNNKTIVLDTPSKLFLSELFRVIDGDLENSAMRALTPFYFKNIELIMQYKNKWTVVTLGYLLGMLEHYKEKMLLNNTSISQENYKDVTEKLNPREVKILLLSTMLRIQQSYINENNILDETIADVDQINENEFKLLSEEEMVKANEEKSLESEDEEMLERLSNQESKALMHKGIKNLEIELPEINEDAVSMTEEEIQNLIYGDVDANEALKNKIEDYSQFGTLTSSEYKALHKASDKINEIADPITGKQTLKEYSIVTEEDLKLDKEKCQFPDNDNIPDKTMLESTLKSMTSDYVSKVMQKEIAAMVLHFQKEGIAITGYELVKEENAMGGYYVLNVHVKPIDGKPSTLPIRFPIVKEDGTFVANGVKFRMRGQITDAPIRKISFDRVALSSFYGKVSVYKSNKKAIDTIDWLVKTLTLLANDPTDQRVNSIGLTDVFDNNFVAPAMYSGLSRYIKIITINGIKFNFDHRERAKLVKPEELPMIEKHGVLCGMKGNTPVVMNDSNQLFTITNNEAVEIGDIFSLALIDRTKAPIDYASLKVYAKTIPIGFVLGFYIGFDNLLRFLKAKFVKMESGKRIQLTQSQWGLRFKDYKYIFDRNDTLVTLIMAGFREYKDSIKNINVTEFNKRVIYYNVIENNGIGARYLDEVLTLDNLFIDPTTKDILKQMNEPTTFKGLLVRASELLMTDYHPNSIGVKHGVIWFYDRIPGFIYSEMSKAVRDYKRKNTRGKSKIEMSPFQVWRAILDDPTVKQPNDINPLQNLKEAEAITYVGEGGREKDSMSKETRAYDQGDMGVISEAGVDSSAVGINLFLTGNPQFTTLRGIPRGDYNFEEDGATSLLSTSVLASAGAYKDDMKRAVFISIQQGHTVACDGYRQPIVGTGMEYIIARRTDNMFAYSATMDGVVSKVKPDVAMMITYADGKEVGIHLGRQYGRAEGHIYPHDIKTRYKEGDVFKKGDVLAYNTGFFEPCFYDERDVVWKSGIYVRTVLEEKTRTFEDSSVVSEEVSQSLTSTAIVERKFTVEFKQAIRDIKKPGTKVDVDTPLMYIEDELTSAGGMFDDETIALLQAIPSKAPRAKVIGKIDKIEVYYHGELEDMSPSLKAIAATSDKQFAEKAKLMGEGNKTGRVNSDYRSDGKPLMLDHAEIKIYIEHKVDVAVGDKGVFANQMKSIFGEVMKYKLVTEDGRPVHARFSNLSFSKRIVISGYEVGTCASALIKLQENAISLYETGKV